MRSSWQKTIERERQEKEPLGSKVASGSKIALRWLKSSVAQPKEFAGKMGIGERQVYKWMNEEVEIPKERVEQILTIARMYMIPLSKLRDETDLFLEAMNDPGSF